MKKGLLLFTLLLSLSWGIRCNASSLSGESDWYLKVFTPCHGVKSVLSYDFAEISEPECLDGVTQDEIDLMASVVYAESRGEPYNGKVGVASVILNRLLDPRFPKSIADIVFQKNAFSCVKNGRISGKPDGEAYKAVSDAIKGSDPTDESIFFYNPELSTSNWIKNCPKGGSIKIGSHIFFK